MRAAPAPLVLAVHSATGFSGYAASDVVPERIAAMVYVDTAPGKGALDPELRGRREADRLGGAQGGGEPRRAQRGAARDVPRAGGRRSRRASCARATSSRTTPGCDIPSTVIATGYTAADYQKYAREHPEWAFLAGIPELRNITWIDLPTSHWPMWSKPAELARDPRRCLDRGRCPRDRGGRPMTASLLDDAFAHHVWATERLIDACAALSPEQLRTPAPGTYGSIIATLRHLVSSDGWYLGFFGEQPAPIDEEADSSLAELRSAITANGVAWKALLATGPDGETDIVEHGEGWDFHSPLGFRLAQVVHHGTDHRSQVCTALTSLGHRAARDRRLGLRRGDRPHAQRFPVTMPGAAPARGGPFVGYRSERRTRRLGSCRTVASPR